MAEISASMVMKLRKISGQGMMDCKKALQEADGDIEQAVVILRKKGLATLAKRAERETPEGTVILCKGDGWASLVTLCCETDFVARSDDFIAMVDAVKDYVAVCRDDQAPESILETSVNGRKFNDILTQTVSKTGEKIAIGDYARFNLSSPGLIGTYIHFNGKVGSMVEIQTGDDKAAAADVLKQAAGDIAMHVTAAKPLALDQSGIAPEVIEQEKSIFAEQVKGKPANIVDKIVEGKMKKFYAENCLLLQPFVKDDSKTIAQVLADAARQAGGTAKIKRFVRFAVG